MSQEDHRDHQDLPDDQRAGLQQHRPAARLHGQESPLLPRPEERDHPEVILTE